MAWRRPRRRFPRHLQAAPSNYAIAIPGFALPLAVCWVGRSEARARASTPRATTKPRPRAPACIPELVKLVAFARQRRLIAAFGAVWAYYSRSCTPGFAFDPLLALAPILMAFLAGGAAGGARSWARR